MKKLFIVFAISSLGFVACNSAADGETSTEGADTTAIETSTEVAPTDTSATMNMDTTATAPATGDTAAAPM